MADDTTLAALVAELSLLRQELASLREELSAERAQNAELRRLLFGKK